MSVCVCVCVCVLLSLCSWLQSIRNKLNNNDNLHSQTAQMSVRLKKQSVTVFCLVIILQFIIRHSISTVIFHGTNGMAYNEL